MAQAIKVLAAKPSDRSSISKTNMVKRKNQLPQTVLWQRGTRPYICPPCFTHTWPNSLWLIPMIIALITVLTCFSVIVIKHSGQNQIMRRKGLFSLHLQVAISHWGRSRWESESRNWSRDFGALLALSGLYLVCFYSPGPPALEYRHAERVEPFHLNHQSRQSLPDTAMSHLGNSLTEVPSPQEVLHCIKSTTEAKE